MSWKNVKLIFSREVRDQLRDRRTLFMIAILPLLLYPSLGIGMVQMMVLFSEQPRTVVILGAKDLPKQPELLAKDGNQFVGNYFKIPADAEKLHVYTDTDVRQGKITNPDVERLVGEGEKIRELVARQRELTKAKNQWKESQPFPQLAELAQVKKELGSLVEGVQIVLMIPQGFGEHLKKMNRQLASRDYENVEQLAKKTRPIILQNSADEKSQVAYNRVSEAIRAWEDVILKNRLSEAKLPKLLAEPVQAEKIDLAEDKQLSAFIWSKLFPALLVIMAVTGAFYPAVDLAAGEKERGTMETLLICPASRTEIVLGKFFTVMLFSISTAILNLISMGLTSKYMASIASAGPLAKIGSLQPPPMASLLWIAAILVPLAALFQRDVPGLGDFCPQHKRRPILSYAVVNGHNGADDVLPIAGH